MTTHLDLIREHRQLLIDMLATLTALPTDAMPFGIRTLMRAYANILQDGISTLNSLISYLDHDL